MAGEAAHQWKRDNLRGTWAAMPLAWNDDDTLDVGVMRELVARYAAAGIDGVYCTGTDGEFHVLGQDAFEVVVAAFARATADAGLPAQAGVGWLTARGIAGRAQIALDAGMRCVQVAPPSWDPLNPDELTDLYANLAERFPDLALVPYNTHKAGRVLDAADFRRLVAACPTLVGSKYDELDRAAFTAMTAANPELHHFVVDAGVGPREGTGTRGMYCFMTNFNPAWTADWWRAAVAGDWPEVERRYALVLRLMDDWGPIMTGVTAQPAWAKVAARAGILPEMPLRVRAPYRAGSEDQAAQLRRLIAERYPELVYRA